jgi:hypothetical protein
MTPRSYRQVAVRGSGGVAAWMIIRVRHGIVWLSIEPLFTWEAILDPAKLDEFILTLESARDEARRMPQRNTTKNAEE